MTADNEDRYIDVLLFHAPAVRSVVIEPKAGRFRREHAGQLGFYVVTVDDQLRNPAVHASTVGILLCTSRTENAVEYALRASNAPMAIATSTDETLPDRERAALPPVEVIAHAFGSADDPADTSNE